MVRRHELTDQEWELLAPLIPRAATGRPRMEDRQVINGMVYKIRTGISWRDLPERYGPWKTVYTRFRRYTLDGVFTRALQQIQAQADADGDIDWLVQIDSTIVRAHQHAAATPKRGRHWRDEPDDHALGRSRGGLTTKIHIACDGKGRPLAILVTPGQRHDSVCARPLLERIRVPRTGPGRPRCSPGQVIADKAYSSRGFRVYLRRRGIAHTIPEKADQRQHRLRRGGHGGRPPGFDRVTYRRRNMIERCFNRLKHNKALATRYDKLARHYQALVTIAVLQLWLP
ncbi:IS5 family transposase [Streptomyces sp. HP-A2021]|uniref:IS5 family transposase n=1 Tax=Streptomyces sp. HP-A2021 TaxID=2927875 RepID=UPI001FAEE605|nr:IS5 family transposase [Streptomyces sp. HP-A2021]UOB15360.1 IS5 family transposase [Streptomyces sp. HP-A2021]